MAGLFGILEAVADETEPRGGKRTVLPLPVRTGVGWEHRPPASGPKLAELLTSLAECRRGRELDKLLWVLEVAVSWLTAGEAIAVADLVSECLGRRLPEGMKRGPSGNPTSAEASSGGRVPAVH